MDYDFLDSGLPVEPSKGIEASNALAHFRKYCKTIGKEESKLSKDELNKYYETL